MSDAVHFAALSQGDFVDLTLSGRREQWRVNLRVEVGTDTGARDVLTGFLSPALSSDEQPTALPEGTVGLVFQQADAEHEWLVVTVRHTSADEYTFEKAAFADTAGATAEFDDPDIDLHSMAASLEDLRGDDDA